MQKYYSGQGIFSVAERDAAGIPKGFLDIGNVSEATIDIEVEKEEHTESRSGQRAIDVTVITSKSGTLTMTVENFESKILALGLHGASAILAAATITDELVHMQLDYPSKLEVPKLADPANVVVTDLAGVTTYVENTDYTVDADWGMITPLSTGDIVDASTAKVTYDHEAVVKLEVFSEAAPVRWVRFHGVNTVDSLAKKVVNIFKVEFDPITGYSLISEEIQGMELTGSILFDDTRPANTSNFMNEYDIAAPTT